VIKELKKKKKTRKQFLKKKTLGFLSAFSSYIFGFLLIEILFRKGPFFIIFHSIPIGLAIFFLLSMVLSLIDWLKRYLNKALSHIIIFIFIVSIVLLYGGITFNPSPKKLITKYITETMPPSITDIKGVIEYPAIDHIIRIAFKINKKDFKKYLLNGKYRSSNDDFPYTLPTIEEYKWWNVKELKGHQQFKRVYSDGIQYLWYDAVNNYVYFLRVRSQGTGDG
jgi:hypothetical protein